MIQTQACFFKQFSKLIQRSRRRRMGNSSEMRQTWVSNTKKPFLIASPSEDPQRGYKANQTTQDGVRAGVKAASIACVASAIPTLIAVRTLPWAKRNLNFTGQALIVSSASVAAFFIAADKTILAGAKRNTLPGYDKTA